MASMEGRVVLVTGATDGIGKQTAIDLARMGATVLVHGRNREKGKAVIDKINKETGNDNLELFIIDLSSQEEVRLLASEIKETQSNFHVLINNAGTFQKERRLTVDRIETTFAVNFLAPFLLTSLLLDLLKKSPSSRIINVASDAHFDITNIDWNNLQGERHYDGYHAYDLSKLADILFTYELAEKLKGSMVTANCLHPGVINTKLLKAGYGYVHGEDVQKGARTPVYLASSPQVDGISGKYFKDCRPARSSPLSYNKDLQERFWQLAERLTGLT